MRRGLRVGGLGLGGLDRDARNFAIRAQLTDTTQLVAVHNLVRGIKQISGGSVWAGLNLCYPFVGGNAAAHSLNLKNPSAFPITWSGPITHSAMGAVGQAGSVGMGDTGFVASSNNAHLSAYASASNGAFSTLDWGAMEITGALTDIRHSMDIHWPGNVFKGDIGDYNLGRNSATVNTARGWTMTTRQNLIQTAYKNSSSISSETFSSGPKIPAGNYRLFRAANVFTCPGRTYAFATQGAPLTAAEALALYNVIQSFQVALGRAVVP